MPSGQDAWIVGELADGGGRVGYEKASARWWTKLRQLGIFETMLFEDFDFKLLNEASFKEDSVREELIAPMLKALGYSAGGPNQIIRSQSLLHPYVYIGTKKYPITLIPDYLLKKDGKPFVIIDAKTPSEEVHKGKNVEQAYSYAIHKDVRTEFFALCNGHEFVLFHISHWPEVLSFRLQEISQVWETLVRLIGVGAERKRIIFKPDLGIHMMRLGFGFDQHGKKINQLFASLDLFVVARVDESTYTFQTHIAMGDVTFLGTFDFSKELLPEFLNAIEPRSISTEVRQRLQNAPFMWNVEPGKFGFVGLSCKLGDRVFKNEDEEYWPFIVEKFI
jgi:hypothetical protein